MAGVHSRARSFDGAAEAYERGRPGWPPRRSTIAPERLGLDARRRRCSTSPPATGKLTRVLRRRFASVIAVEPLDGMRAVLEAQSRRAGARRHGRAIPLADRQWSTRVRRRGLPLVRPGPAVAEIARVLRSGGGVAVLYNRLDWQDAAGAVARGGRLRSSSATGSRPTTIDPYDQPAWRPRSPPSASVRDRTSVERHVQRARAPSASRCGCSTPPVSGLAGPPARAPRSRRSPRSARCS